MKKKNRKKSNGEEVSESILGKLDKIIPGFHGFLKKAGESKIFGARMTTIRKEIDRRFGTAKK